MEIIGSLGFVFSLSNYGRGVRNHNAKIFILKSPCLDAAASAGFSGTRNSDIGTPIAIYGEWLVTIFRIYEQVD